MVEKDGHQEKDLGQTEIDKVFVEHGKPVGDGAGSLDASAQPNLGATESAQPWAVPSVIGEGVVNPDAQTEVDLTLVDSQGLTEVEELILEESTRGAGVDVSDLGEGSPEELLLVEQMPGGGYGVVSPDEVDTAITRAEDEVTQALVEEAGDYGVIDGARVPLTIDGLLDRIGEGSTEEAEGVIGGAILVEGPGEEIFFEDDAYEAGLGDTEAEDELGPEYGTEADFRNEMSKRPDTTKLLKLFDSLKGERSEFRSREDRPPCLVGGGVESPDVAVYSDHVSLISETGNYFIRLDGKFQIGVDGYITDATPFDDLKKIRSSVARLQRAFFAFHELRGEEADYYGEETRFLDGSTCLVGGDPLEIAYTKLSERKEKLPGQENVLLGNEQLTISVYNPGRPKPVFNANIMKGGDVEIEIGYSGRNPATFASIFRGLETVEAGYKAFMGLDISPKAEG